MQEKEERLQLLQTMTPERRNSQEAYFDLKTPDVFGLPFFSAKRSAVDLTAVRTAIVEIADGLDVGVDDYRVETVYVLNPVVVAFYHAFERSAKTRQIPLYLAWADETAGMILHGLYDDRLSPEHWAAYEAVGYDVARSSGFKVRHIGLGVWVERELERMSAKERARRCGRVVSPISGLEQTIEERIAEAEAHAKELVKRSMR